MCHGHVDSRYAMRDIEARLRPLTDALAEPAPARSGWLTAFAARIAMLVRRPLAERVE